MHCATQSVRLWYTGAAQDANDVYGVHGNYGSMRSRPHQWVHCNMSVVSTWPDLGLHSLREYKPPKRRKGAMVRQQIDCPRGPLFVPPSVEIIADPHPIDSDASVQVEVAEAPSRVQPPRASKLWRVAIIETSDAEVTWQPSSSRSSSSSSSSSSGGSSSSSDSDSAGASYGTVASRDRSACTSSAVEVSSSRSTAVEAALAPPLAKKKFRRSVVCATQPAVSAAIDVDAESSSAPAPHLLSEGDFFPTYTEVALRKKERIVS